MGDEGGVVPLVQGCEEVPEGGLLDFAGFTGFTEALLRLRDACPPFVAEMVRHAGVVLPDPPDVSGSVAAAYVVVDPELQAAEPAGDGFL